MSGSGLIIILFTDLVGSTDLTSDIGDVAADDLRRAHFTALREAMAATGGTEVKTIGDAVMASYAGAADALAGAVAMQRSVDRQNRRADGPALAMRVGVSAGDATFEDGDWFGTPVIEASRLCAVADGGQILISDLVKALAGSRNADEIRSLGTRELKGLPEPVAVSEVIWSAGVDHSVVPLPEVAETASGFTLAGRSEEMDTLVSAWKEAVEGERRLVLISGEPGIGKTRLVTETVRVAHDQGGTVLWGRCDPDLGAPFEPFVEALRRYTGAVDGARLRDEVGPLAGELTRLLPELADRVPGLAEPLRSEPDTARHRLFEAVTDLLAASSEAAPVVLVLDDLHWADKPSLLLLRHLLRSVTPLRLLILATYRDTDLDRSHPLAEALGDLRRESGVSRLDLVGLDHSGVEAFMEAAAGHALEGPALALAAAVHAETEGNPFFVGEMLRHLVESGFLVQRDERWTSDFTLAEVGIPEGIREVVGRRLSRLSATANDALAWAAIIGPEFDLAVIEAAGGPSGDDLFDALDEATQAAVLQEVGGTIGRYRFAHALVRSSLYEELSTNRRVRMHWAVGEAIDARSGAGADAALDALAYHYGEGALAGDPERAVGVARRAAARARSELAFEAAVGHLDRALGALDLLDRADPELRADVLLDLGSALRDADDPRRRATAFAAADAARAMADGPRLARAALLLADLAAPVAPGLVDDAVLALYEEATAALGDEPSATRARLLSATAVELQWGPDSTRRIHLADEALAMARAVGDSATLSTVLAGHWAAVDGRASLTAGWVARNEEWRAAAEATGDPRDLHYALRGSIGTLCCIGETDAARRHLTTVDQLADRLRLPRFRWGSLGLHAMIDALVGDLDRAETEVMAGIAVGQAAGLPEGTFMGAAGALLYAIRTAQGRVGELVPALADLVESQPGAPVWRVALGAALVRAGRLEEAQEPFDWLTADGCARIPQDVEFPVTLCGLGLMCLSLPADEATVRAVYDQLAVHAGTFNWSGVSITDANDLGLGALAWALGRYDDADAHFAAAVALCERAGARPFLAWTHHDWARALDRQGRDVEAREHAEAAIAIAEEIGMTGPDGPLPFARRVLGA